MKSQQFVPFGVGVESDIFEELVQPGSMLTLENSVSDFHGMIIKRAGSSILSSPSQATLPAGGALPLTWHLATRAGALLRFNQAPTPFHVWANGVSKWVAPDNGVDTTIRTYRKGPVSTTTTPVFTSTPAGDQVSSPDVATGNGYAVTCYEHSSQLTSSTYSQVVIKDLATGVTVYERTLGASSRRPRPIVVGSRAIVLYDNNGTMQADAYSLTSLTLVQSQALPACTPGTPISVRAGSVTHGTNDISVLYRGDPDNLSCTVIDATNLATNTTFEVQGFGGHLSPPDLAFAWLKDIGASGKLSVITASTTDALNVLWDLPAPTGGFSEATNTITLDAAATAAPSGATAGIRNVIGATTDNAAGGHFRVLYEVTAPSFPTVNAIKTAVWTGSSAVLATLYRGVGIRSELWANDTSFYFWATFAGTDQETYFALAMSNDLTVSADTFPAPQATAFVRSGGGLTERTSHPSSVAVGPNGEYIVAVTHVTRPEATISSGVAIGATVNVKAIDLVSLTHRQSPETQLSAPIEFLGSVFTPGGLLGDFDGATYGLPGFAYYPIIDSGTPIAGGSLEHSAAYLYKAVYSFVDNNGRKWRSAPSIEFAKSTTGSDFQIGLTVEALRLPDRGVPDGRDGYQLEVYRTQANETDAFFLVGSFPNDPTQQAISVTDNVADSALGEELYTDGGGLENQLTPPASQVVQYQNRLIMAEAGKGTLWYSLDIDLNHGLLFNEAFTLDVGDPADPITGLEVSYSGLLVFKKDSLYIVTGEGANSLGQGASYDFRLIENGIGCSNAASIATGPDGSTWFMSNSQRAGIHRVQGATVEYVGQGVRKYNNLTITSAVVVSDVSQVRFYTIDGTTLVFSWTTNTWTTNTDQPCHSAIAGYAGCAGVVYANSDTLQILAEDPESTTEGNVSFTHHLQSPWLAIADMEGWERILRISGVGRPVGPHTLQVKLYRDNDPTDQVGTLTKQFEVTDSKWAWNIKPSVQKLTSLMIDMEVLPNLTYAIAPDAGDAYATVDGDGTWTIPNFTFSSAMVGGTLTIAGSIGAEFDGVFTIASVPSAHVLVMTPPIDTRTTTPPMFAANTGTITLDYVAPTNGPQIAGVSLEVRIKTGLKKQPKSARLTPT